jgi:hypothetical protein
MCDKWPEDHAAIVQLNDEYVSGDSSPLKNLLKKT